MDMYFNVGEVSVADLEMLAYKCPNYFKFHVDICNFRYILQVKED